MHKRKLYRNKLIMNNNSIISQLAQGLSESQVALAVGCSPSYVSQVKALPGFDEKLKEMQEAFKLTAEVKAREKRYEHLEDLVQAKIEENLSYAEFSELTKLMEILHRRKAPAATQINHNTQNNVVVLNIPQAAIPEIILNSKKEVVGIGDQSLAPMHADGVRSLFSKMKKDNKEAQDAQIIKEESKKETMKRMSEHEM